MRESKLLIHYINSLLKNPDGQTNEPVSTSCLSHTHLPPHSRTAVPVGLPPPPPNSDGKSIGAAFPKGPDLLSLPRSPQEALTRTVPGEERRGVPAPGPAAPPRAHPRPCPRSFVAAEPAERNQARGLAFRFPFRISPPYSYLSRRGVSCLHITPEARTQINIFGLRGHVLR